MPMDLFRVTASELLPTSGIMSEPPPARGAGAMSLAHRSTAAFAFMTPRGHKRSINILAPSLAPCASYARFNLTFAATILLLIDIVSSLLVDNDAMGRLRQRFLLYERANVVGRNAGALEQLFHAVS
jgi:hypothetical protein